MNAEGVESETKQEKKHGVMERLLQLLMKSFIVQIVLLVLLPSSIVIAVPLSDRKYQIKYFGDNPLQELKTRLLKLQKEYPEAVTVTTAKKKYGIDSAGTCGQMPCEIYIIEIGTNSELSGTNTISKSGEDGIGIIGVEERDDGDSFETERVPEVFISGAIHGDERVGPIVAIELAEYMLRGFRDKHTWLHRLVTTRKTVIVPVANADGWDKNKREELHLDPNRDYPHDQPLDCMLTQATKAINALFIDHSFITCITFHAGIDLIGYPWGDMKHKRQASSPDNSLFEKGAEILRLVAGAAGKFKFCFLIKTLFLVIEC